MCWEVDPCANSTTCSSNLLNKLRKYHKSRDWPSLYKLARYVPYKLPNIAVYNSSSIDRLLLIRLLPDTWKTLPLKTRMTIHWQIWNSYYQHFIFCYFVAIFWGTWDRCIKVLFSWTIKWFCHQHWLIQVSHPYHPCLLISIECPKLHLYVYQEIIYFLQLEYWISF